MSRSRRRPLRRFAELAALLAILGAGVLISVRWLDGVLASVPYATGYAMFGVVLLLTLYGLRKKLPGLPLGPAEWWMQGHIALGLGSALLFAAHAGWLRRGFHWPDGGLEATLALLFAGTFASGLWGLYLTRAVPRQLARTSQQFVYERIPLLRSGLVRQSRGVVLAAVKESGAVTLADFYTTQLDPYFCVPRGLGYALRPSSRRRRALLAELADLRRVLNDAEAAASETLFTLLRKKDDLDFHQARQGLLKAWLFVHLSLTWLLIAAAALHGGLALAMRGAPA